MSLDQWKIWVIGALDFIFGFRKFIIMLMLILAGIIFLIDGKLTGREFVDLLQATTVSFMAANSVETVGNVVKDWIAKKS